MTLFTLKLGILNLITKLLPFAVQDVDQCVVSNDLKCRRIEE